MSKPVKEEKTKTVSGKDLCTLMGVKSGHYISLYPGKDDIEGYCPCIDLGLKEHCKSMLTVMKVLTRNEIKEFPEETVRVDGKKYNSGDVWIDECYNIAYLYIGKTSNKKDVVLNLGGDTHNQGNFEVGYVNCKSDRERISFNRKVFPL